ncbi:MAG: hypothetical protein ABWY16_03220 [Pedobacter sp.]|uniref:hypothetical protein n=1 Tax=Pedobacter sp. TaxID=1411316 RepID=UPI003397EA29
MKHVTKYLFIAGFGVLSLSACTMGDKGSEKKPDSVTIDTNIKSQSATPAKQSDTTLIDSLQTDTAGQRK